MNASIFYVCGSKGGAGKGRLLFTLINCLPEELNHDYLPGQQSSAGFREIVARLPAFFPDALAHVCRNLRFGSSEKFERYSTSKSREIMERKGRTLDFPDTGDRVEQAIFLRDAHQKNPFRLADCEREMGTPLHLKKRRARNLRIQKKRIRNE